MCHIQVVVVELQRAFIEQPSPLVTHGKNMRNMRVKSTGMSLRDPWSLLLKDFSLPSRNSAFDFSLGPGCDYRLSIHYSLHILARFMTSIRSDRKDGGKN